MKNIYSSLRFYLYNIFEYIEYNDMKQNRPNHLEFLIHFMILWKNISTLRYVSISITYSNTLNILIWNSIDWIIFNSFLGFMEEYPLFAMFISYLNTRNTLIWNKIDWINLNPFHDFREEYLHFSMFISNLNTLNTMIWNRIGRII